MVWSVGSEDLLGSWQLNGYPSKEVAAFSVRQHYQNDAMAHFTFPDALFSIAFESFRHHFATSFLSPEQRTRLPLLWLCVLYCNPTYNKGSSIWVE